MIDWDAIEAEQGGNFKDYAVDGKYKVKVSKVDIKIVGTNGSIAQDFFFEDTDVKYPKATHWLSLKNINWRRLHQRNLMMLLGATKEAAQKAVEMCEAKDGNKATLINAYQAMYDKLIAKAPEVEIEVWQDGDYKRGEFTDKTVRMSKPGDSKPVKKEDTTDILAEAEEVDLSKEDDLGEMPF